MKELTRFLFMMAALAAGIAPAGAQSADSRWQPWIGCWVVSGNVTPAARVCVSPATGGFAVDIVTAAANSATTREHVDATAARRPSERDGCKGWESAEWSADGKRVFLSSEYQCATGPMRSSSGLLAMSSTGQWLSIAGVTIGDNTGVRVVRYDSADTTPVAAAMRAAGAGGISTPEIIEASRHLSAAVVSAWLSESGQVFTADAKRLIALADAKVPDAVIDMLVALSYPGVFAIKPSPTTPGALKSGPSGSVDGFDESVSAAGGCGPYGTSGFDEFGRLSLYGWDGCSMYFGYSGYRYTPYGNRPYGTWYSGAQPVVIVVNPRDGAGGHGQVTKAHGYTQGKDGGGSAASAGGSSSTSGSSAGSGTSSTSGADTSSGGSRTAHPR